MRRTRATALVGAALGVLTVTGFVAGPAAGSTTPATSTTASVDLVTGLAAPSDIAVDAAGSVYVSQLVPGGLAEVSAGVPEAVLKSKTPVTGADLTRPGDLTVTRTAGGSGGGSVDLVLPGGRLRQLADTGAFEAARNPDATSSYGFQDLDPECAEDIPASVLVPGGGAGYAGPVASYPASVLVLPGGDRVVADAAGNAILRIERDGSVSVVAVLPPVPVVVTPAQAATLGLPGCVIGTTYHLEPGPTDVEVGPDGLLYVSTMPVGLGATARSRAFGGPPGQVVSVDPGTGDVAVVARGLQGATDLAVGPDGTIYVAELFGGQVSAITEEGRSTFRLIERPSAVEFADGVLYVAAGFSFGPPSGKVVAVFLR